MEFIVCVKQVPSSEKIDLDLETGSLIRESTGAKINPFDLSAIEACIQMKEKAGGHIHAITMGPKQARYAIREALAFELDSGWHVTDKNFSGADVYVTAYTLARSIEIIGNFDVIVCGKQSTDGDTSQVGSELAEILNIPHAQYVTQIIEITDTHIIVTCDMNQFRERVKLTLPCLISVENNSFIPRLSSLRNKMLAQKKEINELGLKYLKDSNPDHYGYKASPTKVRKIYVPEIKRETIMIKEDAKTASIMLEQKIKEWGGAYNE